MRLGQSDNLRLAFTNFWQEMMEEHIVSSKGDISNWSIRQFIVTKLEIKNIAVKYSNWDDSETELLAENESDLVQFVMEWA